jgi:sugar lactone lactonase YvrE
MKETKLMNSIFKIGFLVSIPLHTCIALGSGTFPDLSTSPILSLQDVERVAQFPYPGTHIAVSSKGNIYLDFNPESGKPFPCEVHLRENTCIPLRVLERDKPHGMQIDKKDRLWILHDEFFGIAGKPWISVYDTATWSRVYTIQLPRLSSFGSSLDDIAIDANNDKVIITDVSSLKNKPSLIVVDANTGHYRRALENTQFTKASRFPIHVMGRPFKVLGLTQYVGVDGIVIDHEQQWLYFATMNGGKLFRIRLSDIENFSLSDADLERRVETVAKITMSDGINIDTKGRVYLTDVEHNSIQRLRADGSIETLAKLDDCRWPAQLAFSKEGDLYFTCQSYDINIFRSPRRQREMGPYPIYKIRASALE